MSTAVTSFMDAVRSRYGAADDTDSYSADAFLVGSVGRHRNKKWELVGMEKTRQKQAAHSRLAHIVLRDMHINAAECCDGELAAAAMHRVEEVDLSGNPALSIGHIGDIVRHLPALTVLQLSENPQLLASPGTGLGPVLGTGPGLGIGIGTARLTAPRLRKLVLHAVGLRSIGQLRALVDVPTLEELHLDNNAIERLVLGDDSQKGEEEEKEKEEAGGSTKPSAAHSESATWFPSVRTLSLAQNRIACWGSASGLNEVLTTAFPHVTRLFLTGNLLPNLCYTPGEAMSTDDLLYLRPLELLCVNENPTITDPGTVDAIRELCPKLLTFRITYGPMFPQWNETLGRMHVVASLPHITVLNRGEVRPKERLDSELFYVQRGLASRQKEQEQKEAQQQEEEEKSLSGEKPKTPPPLRYPLLDALREKHKDVILAIYREGETASHDGTTHLMLNLTLRCDGFEDAQKRVPSSLSVGKLKALTRVVFGVTPADQRLSYFTSDTGVFGCATELDNEMNSLGFYGVCDGGIIRVVDTSLR